MAWNDDIRNWLKETNTALAELSRKTDIKPSTLGDYIHGRIKTLSEEKRIRLYEATNIETLSKQVQPLETSTKIRNKPAESPKTYENKVNKEKMYEGILYLESALNTLKQAAGKDSPREEYTGKIKEISDMFYTMIEKMEYLKHAPMQEREKLTRAIDARDMGYFISFMNAIYKPDTFSTWLMSAGYIPKRKEKK